MGLWIAYDQYVAEKACKSDLKEVAGISGVTWRLPSIDEFKVADKSGIRKALPSMNYWFWSSTEVRGYDAGAWLFYGGNGFTGYLNRRDSNNSVRCVAR